MPYPKLDRDQLAIKKLGDRKSKVVIERDHIPVTRKPANLSEIGRELIEKTAGRIRLAKQEQRSVMLAFGAHTIKNGMAPTLIALMDEGWVTHLSTNGAGIIHDWEFAFQGKSSEDVRENVEHGQFGIWDETGFYINLALIVGAYEGLGYGESVGKMISLEGLQIPEVSLLHDEAIRKIGTSPDLAAAAIDLAGVIEKYELPAGFMSIPHPFKKYSVQARAYQTGIPFTGHPMIGHDIIYNHPMNHGAALGRTALNDFLSFAKSVSNLDYGVYLSIGSAVMSPMIFEKALSMSQNLKIQEGRHIDHHYMLIVDLAKSDWDWQKNGEPPMDNPAYYLRYCKTFQRMGGEMDYLTADNRDFLLGIYQELSTVNTDAGNSSVTPAFRPGATFRPGAAFRPERHDLAALKQEAENHLVNELLPFWTTRMIDEINGGYLTHFDQDGHDSGEDEKSLIAQTRCLYTMASAHRAGYGEGKYAALAKHGADFLINKMWDQEHGGFFWMMDRKGKVKIDQKIIYGHSFAIYSLSEYTLATGDPRGLEYAGKVFDLIQKYCADTRHGGYWEMFHRDWTLCADGSQGGDRKTLDVHMHLMEAFTTLYECSGQEVHRRKLLEDIDLLIHRIIHPVYKTGIPQFFRDWTVAPQIKFDIIWGWDRFSPEGQKGNATDNTCFGHNAEFAWLLIHALKILKVDPGEYSDLFRIIFDHTINNGIDYEYGGVYVEGPHSGGVYDKEKEFWQQAEVLIGLLDAVILFGDEKYWIAYKNVHRFVMDQFVNKGVGEWYPLLTRTGEPIWTHMSHSWKINYHTVRAMVQSIRRMEMIKTN